MNSHALKILLVEDDPLHRDSVFKLLSRQGWEVRALPTATEAFHTARVFEPDVLVADWMLPDKMTGGVLATLLRSFQPELRIVFITALPVRDLEPQVEHLHPCDLIQKPYGSSELVDAIRQATSRTAAACPDATEPAVLLSAPADNDGAE